MMGWRAPINHWHLVIKEGEPKPRVVKVRDRTDAELEARLESEIPEPIKRVVPFREVKLVACWDRCLG